MDKSTQRARKLTNINREIDRATYQSEAIFDGTYSYDGQLTFDTSLFGGELTSLPHFFSLKANDEQLSLGSEETDTFSVEANGVVLTKDADAETVSQFSTHITNALAQANELLGRVEDKELFLNIRTKSVYETEIEPTDIETQTLSNNQRILLGMVENGKSFLYNSGLIIDISI